MIYQFDEDTWVVTFLGSEFAICSGDGPIPAEERARMIAAWLETYLAEQAGQNVGDKED